jgi:two-component system CAI-1 autoinducer sensor kinase/phosphatase CqsS
MYSILPALVSALFIGYGIYVLSSRGPSRVSLTFFLVCVMTFSWQAAWALLFQVRDESTALAVAQLGYLFILFLPTTLYHFITELTGAAAERRWAYASYGLAFGLGLLVLLSDWVVGGVSHYFFGFYPRAGWLHPLHLAQTAAVVGRGLWLLFQRQLVAVSTEKARLRYCLLSVLIYFAAAIDYLCNYGLAFYPPGVIFIAASLGLIAQAMVRHNLLADPMAAAATIAHEMRTPLATIRSQTRVLARVLPELIRGYQPTRESPLAEAQLRQLGQIARCIDAEVQRSNLVVDMLLAAARDDVFHRESFHDYSIRNCVTEAIACYPFGGAERELVSVDVRTDYRFRGSDVLLMYVLYNLLKNALLAVKMARRGKVAVECFSQERWNWVVVTDTGQGIAPDVLPHVFDPYYTTRRSGGGAGIGLAFCQRVVTAFGGQIRCESTLGSYTRVSILLPPDGLPGDAAREYVAEHHPVAHQAE